MPKKQASMINRINIFSMTIFRCTEYLEKIDEIVEFQIKPGDTVFLGIDWTKNGGKKDLKNIDLVFYDLAKRIVNKNAYFVLMGDIPDIGEPFICKKAWYRIPKSACNIPISVINDYQKSLDEIGENLMKLHPNAKYIKIRDALCENKSMCSSYINGEYIWRDQGHLTPAAAKKYTSDKFRNLLDEIYGRDNY